MPRRIFKRYMPHPDSIREHKSLRFLGTLIHDPNLWHLNRHSVSRAMLVGLFSAFIPIPMQMLLAAGLAIPVRANLPIAIGLVWLTNPITMPPVFYCTYKVGSWVLDTPPITLPSELSMAWISERIATLWEPILVGSFITGVVLGVVGYFATMLFWRWWVRHNWRKRQERRRNPQP
ncbi:hypothetical protein AvCA_14720 [Azotobacter vinelandii CA]|uniref:DUF2062 domain-containing protein n=3 Tax=Azotobacter group TaxID=351 RepID=C1DR15_AZOVD|nr:DUF2062 domain-containing protein [Azotobacter vinelandii]ACO77688.1 conserved hypothetical protein [Azotobacter vinelandii DJ]AGK16996.1 hypothetical protein AvCA_14720 [Azotobacter vinelandii CA]AGK19925.1 hypothetical protein AvCA6_14720 [Azotobacter vinelandii CA6]WKN23452.1 DUF2062 domain-containing protein [Azotobacter vinelandii]SFX83090.1 hypothetical protein SAMN04244547_02908 [Azotobacter vinelandii]